MSPAAYYNEHDPNAAAWLRELIASDLIAPGEVDERSIVDVTAGDLAGFTQCHFFAGIGVWSYALRRAGWRDDRPVWTGSCPCQPFSDAGAKAGFGDERHLWPDFFRLISERRPLVCFGEQVASPLGRAWLDVVSADVEGVGYAIGAADISAASVGAPHIRQRLYWVAESALLRRVQRELRHGEGEAGSAASNDVGRRSTLVGVREFAGRGAVGGMADTGQPERAARGRRVHESTAERRVSPANAERCGSSFELGDASSRGCGEFGDAPFPRRGRHPDSAIVSGFWRDADWIYCRDEKWRPIEPGTFPLATGAPARVGRLRGYGNALNAETAIAFVEAYLDVAGFSPEERPL